MRDTDVVGVISDTHGLLRPEAVDALRGSRLIIHAGDIGSPDVLFGLGDIAPVVAIRGNVDRAEWASPLPARNVVYVWRHALYILHDVAELGLDEGTAGGMSAVISDHSHTPCVEHRAGVLFLNPGSAGPRRFNLPTTIARLTLVNGQLHAELVHLGQGSPPRRPLR